MELVYLLPREKIMELAHLMNANIVFFCFCFL